jgi:hypothetical protein
MPNGCRPDTTAVRVTSILGTLLLSASAYFYCIGHRVRLGHEGTNGMPRLSVSDKLRNDMATFRDVTTFGYLPHLGKNPISLHI